MSGEDTRENLSEHANKLANSARESYEQGRERIQRGVEQAKATAGRAIDQMRTGTERHRTSSASVGQRGTHNSSERASLPLPDFRSALEPCNVHELRNSKLF